MVGHSTLRERLIPRATIKYGTSIFIMSPEELASNDHLLNLINKREAVILCPAGCTLKLVPSKNGKKRPFFSHISTVHTKNCDYVKKYPGGESHEHLDTKMKFGNTKTVQQLCMGCSRPTWSMNIDSTWSYSTEVRINIDNGNYIIVDGMFRDKDVITLIVEIKHTHGTGGIKRTWLLTQLFEYIEAKCGSGPIVNVIDSKHEPKFCDECAHQKEQQEHKKEQQEKMRQLREDEHRKRDKRRREEEEQVRRMEREKRARQDKAKEKQKVWLPYREKKKTEEDDEKRMRDILELREREDKRKRDILELREREEKRREEEDTKRMKDALEQKERTRKLKIEEGKKQDNITFGHFYNDIRTRHGEASADFMVGLAESTHVSTKE